MRTHIHAYRIRVYRRTRPRVHSRARVSRTPSRIRLGVGEPPPTFSTTTLPCPFNPSSFPFLRTRVSRVRTFRGYSLGIERALSLSLSLALPLAGTQRCRKPSPRHRCRGPDGQWVQRTAVYFSWTETSLTLPVSPRRCLFRARANARPRRSCRASALRAHGSERSRAFGLPLSRIASLQYPVKSGTYPRVAARMRSRALARAACTFNV